MTNAKVYQGLHGDNKVEEHWCRWNSRHKFRSSFALRLDGRIDMLFFRCFVCNLWFLFIVRV